MTRATPPALLDEIAAAVPTDSFATRAEVHRALGRGSAGTVGNVLLELWRAKRLEREPRDGGAFAYRRPAEVPAEALAPSAQLVPLDKIRRDGGTQPRGMIHQNVVDDYAEVLAGGGELPRADVFFDGENYWLADGFHRDAAHRQAARLAMACTVHQGTQRDAILFSVGANAAHGLRRTVDDKRRAVMRLLTDGEWAQWSDREIARRCAVGPDLVGKMRASLSAADSEPPAPRTYVTKHGTVATMDTAAINRGRAAEPVISAVSAEPMGPPPMTSPLPVTAFDPHQAAEIKRNYSLMRGEVQAEKAERRAEREQQLGERIRSESARLGADGKLYGVIYADPPWQTTAWGDETGHDRSAENHYPTMSVDELQQLDPPAAYDSVLLLWARPGRLDWAMTVLEGWGYTYRSENIWRKPHIGLGRWNRNRHEILLIGVRGAVPAPTPGTQLDSIVDAPRGEHSEKPEVFADWIERTWPSLPKLEMFSRAARRGWDVWGAEADGDA